jgi:hypothetical protein
VLALLNLEALVLWRQTSLGGSQEKLNVCSKERLMAIAVAGMDAGRHILCTWHSETDYCNLYLVGSCRCVCATGGV